MPTVPSIPGGESAYGSSPTAQPSASDLLMSAAEMHRSGALTKFKEPNPVHPHSLRKKLKVIK